MSKVTDRLDNKQIVELAKQQYENQKQTSKFPANIITLPSNGNVYAETSALRSGKVEMRHMTAYDEDILSNSSYIKEGVIFDKLLEALIITADVNINSEKLTSSFLKLSIQSVNGNDAPQEIEDYLKYDFKAIDSRKFKKHIIETAPSIDYNIKVIGADGDTIDATFQFNADLFWF